jgi:hypothetical protein
MGTENIITNYRADNDRSFIISTADLGRGQFTGKFEDYTPGGVLEDVHGTFHPDKNRKVTVLNFQTSKEAWTFEAPFFNGRADYSEWNATSGSTCLLFYRDYHPTYNSTMPPYRTE